MLLQTYFNRIKEEFDRYATTRFVLNAQINFDLRPGDQGYLSGVIQFVNGADLHFTEYVDVRKKNVDKLAYSYHFQDAGKNLIFRYDNATHKPQLSSADHKHLPNQIIAAAMPQFNEVLAEIFLLNGWTQ